MPVTLHDVAVRARVSTATASRALRGLPRVSPATRVRVASAARELGYVASPAAARLATGRTHTVGVVVPFVDRWFFGQVIAGAEAVLRAAGLDLLLYNLGGREGRSRFFAEMPLRRRVDAVLLLSLPLDEAERARLRSLDVPLAAVGIERGELPCVGIDDTAGAEAAMRHLAVLGHRDIAFIGGGTGTDLGFHTPLHRREAWLRVLRTLGCPDGAAAGLEADGGFTLSGGQAAMSRLLTGERRPTAVFAASDEMAYGALRALRRSGLRVPEDVSLIGFDNHEMADLLDLTTIAQPVALQGRLAAGLIIDQLTGVTPPPGPRELPCELVLRGSTAPPPPR